MRWAIGRKNYKIDPGLYALGAPDENSPVLVSANYKLSFDSLRSSLPGRSVWILALDTDGINVWCAAGKGTFGTAELAARIEAAKLAEVVRHRKVIVPQLGASGVSAHEVPKQCGFKVVYGPVRAEDLPAFIDSGMKASPAMRTKTFSAGERLSLVPVEVVHAFKYFLIALPFILLFGGFKGHDGFLADALRFGGFTALGFLTALAAGCVLTPLLLPWLPGRAFSLKGAWTGMICALFFLMIRASVGFLPSLKLLEFGAWVLLIPGISAYLAMGFTGCSTYTSLSGVKKEMKWAVPAQIISVSLGVFLWIFSIVR